MKVGNITSLPARTVHQVVSTGQLCLDLGSMSILLLVRLTDKGISAVGRGRFFPSFLKGIGRPLTRIANRFYYHDRSNDPNISKVTLIDLALKNMAFKKTRSFITIGGMSIGIGAIVFLVSIGYGVQRLVVSSVARLDELRQADVATQPGSQLKITEETINSLTDSPSVEYALPLIAVVGRINFQNSVTDMAVYGVTSEYLRQSAVQPTRGGIFQNDDQVLASRNSLGKGVVAGVSTEQAVTQAEQGDSIGRVFVQMDPGGWYRVRSAPNTKAEIVGYTKREEGQQMATAVWGEAYSGGELDAVTTAEGKELGRWIQGQYLLWEKTDCQIGASDCEPGGYQVKRDETGQQAQQLAYIAQLGISTEPVAASGEVLGTSIDIADLVKSGIASSGAEVALTQLASQSASLKETVNQVTMGPQAVKELVINTAGLKALGILPEDAVGSEFTIAFVVPADLLEDDTKKIESEPTTYKIVGVIPDDSTPFLYVPFIDLRTLGITNYSQLKVVSNSDADLASVRQMAESMGFVTISVVDTIEQIDKLFASVRLVLAALGLIALVVASLGMFNTLTVSLLERTREVGLLKAIGMKSVEVRRLFITESLIMGFFGGLGGIFIGYLAGKVVSVILSSISLTSQAQWLDVTYIPPAFSLTVFALSLLVGILTGLYPARRSKKISALDALRYE